MFLQALAQPFASAVHQQVESDSGVPFSPVLYFLKVQEIKALPTRYETQFDLPPGEYSLRVVLSDGKNFGRAEVPLNIEKYDKKELALSSVMLCKRIRDAHAAAVESSAANFAPQYVPLVTKGIQVTPTGDTRFKQGEPLYGYFELYELQLAGQPTVDAHLRVVDAKTGEVKISVHSLSAESYRNAGSPVIPIGREIKTDKLPSGSYRLEVQAVDSTGKSTVWRAATFTVE